jgi:hypothetical protein
MFGRQLVAFNYCIKFQKLLALLFSSILIFFLENFNHRQSVYLLTDSDKWPDS